MTLEDFKSKYREFLCDIGLLSWHEDLEEIGLPPRDVAGGFWQKDIPRLLRFCRENKSYHIVSLLDPSGYANTYVPGCRTYFIAEGNPDPTLSITWPQEALDSLFSNFAGDLAELLKPHPDGRLICDHIYSQEDCECCQRTYFRSRR